MCVRVCIYVSERDNVCALICTHGLYWFSKNQEGAQIGAFANIMTVSIAVIVSFTVAIGSHLSISLPSKYSCFLKASDVCGTKD